jgi:hypothetical protein
MAKITGWKKDKKAEQYGVHFWSRGRNTIVEVTDTMNANNVVRIVKNWQSVNKTTISKPFPTKEEAFRYAYAYMRRNP